MSLAKALRGNEASRHTVTDQLSLHTFGATVGEAEIVSLTACPWLGSGRVRISADFNMRDLVEVEFLAASATTDFARSLRAAESQSKKTRYVRVGAGAGAAITAGAGGAGGGAGLNS